MIESKELDNFYLNNGLFDFQDCSDFLYVL